MATVAGELAMLAYDEQSGSAGWKAMNLDVGLAGAVLADLSLAGRLQLNDGNLAAIDAPPSGDPVADHVMARIRDEEKSRTPKWWVQRLSRDVRQPLLDQLVAAGVLRQESGKMRHDIEDVGDGLPDRPPPGGARDDHRVRRRRERTNGMRAGARLGFRPCVSWGCCSSPG
jgi:hypothetical protein